MTAYIRASGIVFTLMSLGQLTRLLFRWPVHVASFRVPLWISAVAFLVVGSMAVWAFRSARATKAQG
jgi:hypothetical protein